ncbi:phosphatase PAP2 family protein [Yinghuangia seranimata]|uniref:phosphatase PAP2 family protein n=1 Tax=Yinghuangia seranimata TaxID=408067 RepID=UPI00248B3C38|nr:phosphatase PAP2 family protein [Yinghuangia seranimata]MDI2126268.1 phosphatase PAP2 family protein [Yinghuangia seranimata]
MASGGLPATGQVLSIVTGTDVALYRHVRGRTGHPTIQRASKALSFVGEHGGLFLATGLVGAAVDRERRGQWLRATATIATAHAASMALKRVVRRPRPNFEGLEPLVRTAGRHSFPSSHSVSAAASVVAFRGLVPARVTVPAAVAMGFSRLVVGVHYPTDVLGGAAMGVAAARVGRSWSERSVPKSTKGR